LYSFKAEDAGTPSMETYHSLANDLVSFKRFLEEDEVGFKYFPKRKQLRPTYKYRAYLLQQIAAKKIALSTAKRKMGSIIIFYRWLKEEGFISSQFPMFEEGKMYIGFTDSRRSKKVW